MVKSIGAVKKTSKRKKIAKRIENEVLEAETAKAEESLDKTESANVLPEESVEPVKDSENSDQENQESIISEAKQVGESELIEEEKSHEAREAEELGMSKEYANEKLNEAMESMAPKKRKKSIIVSLVFLLINVVFMVSIINGLLGNLEENNNLMSVINSRGENLWWLVGGILLYVVFVVIQVVMYYDLIKSFTGRKEPKLAYEVAVVGKYYDNVTPFAVGGQPMQIVKLAKSGISAGISTSIPIIKMIMNSFIHMALALLFFIFGIPQISTGSGLNRLILIIFVILGIVGLVVSLLVTLFMLLLSTGSFVTRSFISGVLRLGYKMKLVKNYRAALRKTINQVSEYRNSMKYLMKNKGLFFRMIIYNIIECLSYAMMSYFVVRAFVSGADTTTFTFFLACISKYYICYMASCYIPLPGGTGLMEITFIFLFGIVVGDFVVWALLAWRIISYYFILVHGFSHEMVSIFKNLSRNRKKKEAS